MSSSRTSAKNSDKRTRAPGRTPTSKDADGATSPAYEIKIVPVSKWLELNLFRTTLVLFMSVCGVAPYSSPLGGVATRAAAQHYDADVGDRVPRDPTEAPRGHACDVSF